MAATISHYKNSGLVGIPSSCSADANSTWKAKRHMQYPFRPRMSESELMALYQRRKTILSLIRSLERYRRAKLRAIHVCSRRTSPVAA